MKFLSLVALAGLLTLPLPVVAAGLSTIDGAQLRALMADGKPLTIVDVREPDEFAAGHIAGAMNMPYDGAKVRVLKELTPSQRIVFICHGGPMGDELGKLLAAKGYPAVYNLKGGMKHWNGPVVRR